MNPDQRQKIQNTLAEAVVQFGQAHKLASEGLQSHASYSLAEMAKGLILLTEAVQRIVDSGQACGGERGSGNGERGF